MNAPSNRKYLESHEWHKIDGDTVTIGITQIAADELTDITYVSLPKVGTKVSAGKPFGEIESVKATSDLYSGVSGEVVTGGVVTTGGVGSTTAELRPGGGSACNCAALIEVKYKL